MNNKTVMIIISAIIVVLLAVLLVWGASSCNAETGGEGLMNVGGEHNSSDAALESGESSESEESNIPGVADAPEEWLDEDEEESSKPSENNASSSQSTSSANGSSASSSSESSSSRPSVNIGHSSGNNSSSSSSAPTIDDAESDGKVTYEEYMAMDGDEQKKYLESFESVEKFFEWFNAAKDKYDEEHPSIEIGDGSINMEDIINGNP